MIAWIRTLMHRSQATRDTALIQTIQSGNQEAFGTLYGKYLDPIYRFIFLRVGNDEKTAEDLAETVFVKAWQNIQSFSDQGYGIRPWLYMIARNVITDHFRNRKIPTAPLDDALNLTDGTSAEDMTIRQEETIRIQQLLARLPQLQREIVILRFVEGMSHREIAQTLGKNEDAVRAALYRALKYLKQHTEKETL